MPNPLTRYGAGNTSRRNRDNGVYPDSLGPAPESATPREETYAGDNNPYRGTEQHGVADDTEPRPTPGYNTREVPVRTEAAPPNYEPVPVRIVEEGGRELRSARSVVMYAAGSVTGNAKLILGRDEDRTFARVKNPSQSETIYLSNNQHTADAGGQMSGFPLGPGEHYDTHTQTDLWASCTGSDDLPVPIMIEFSLPIGPASRRHG